MTLATAVGSFPGTDQAAYDEAVHLVLDVLVDDLPCLPEVPGRGAPAGMIGRTVGLLTDLDVDLQPAGWRLTGTSGSPALDQRRARSLLGQDLDGLEEQAQGYAGAFKVQLAGPWTLAATVERPRGDKVLADHGARRDLAQALAATAADHVAALRRRLPDADRLVVQLDEPMLPAVLAGRVNTASGFGRHRTVHPPVVSEALGWVIEAIRNAGAEAWVHCCAEEAPLGLLRDAGASGLLVDLDTLAPASVDAVADVLESGTIVGLGVVPATDRPDPSGPEAPARSITDTELLRRVHRWLELFGLDPADLEHQLVISPGCGLAGASRAWPPHALRLARSVARNLTD